MPAGRGVDAHQSGYDQVVFYIPVVYHVRVSVCDLSLHGLLVEYQEVFSGLRAGKSMDGIVSEQ